ncbi:MAG: Gfo/Idh/MocA family oxidoreductase [Planctomycetes bacterium]|nr:Gfo/Idh/MocA family oxidoreductase [Planctomycetota bacterium]
MTKIGIIGCGGWARNMHLPALRKLCYSGDLTVVAVSDINQEQARAFAIELNCESTFSDYQTMLDSVELDAVSILVPNTITEKIIAIIAQRNLPFICEKPPTSSARSQHDLIQAVGDTPHLVAYNRRSAPFTMAAREWMIQQNIQSISSHFFRHQRKDPDFSSTFVHGLDTTLFLLGQTVVAAQAHIQHQDEVINIGLSMQCADNTYAHLLIGPNAGDQCEHYDIRSASRSAFLAFPQFGMRDLPGYVELFENNELKKRIGPKDCGIHDDNEMEALGGIIAEYKALQMVLANKFQSPSTLSSTLQTQVIREAINTVRDKVGFHELNIELK